MPKQYRVTIDIPMTEEMVRRFSEGIALNDGICRPAELTLEGEYTGTVTLREGRYHQIKRMFGCCGATVTALHRLSMAAPPETSPYGGTPAAPAPAPFYPGRPAPRKHSPAAYSA